MFHCILSTPDQLPVCDDLLIPQPKDPNLPWGVLHTGKEAGGKVPGAKEETAGKVTHWNLFFMCTLVKERFSNKNV